MNAASLAALNPGLRVLSHADPEALPYGRPLALEGLSGLLDLAERLVPEGLEANRYVASEPELEAEPGSRAFAPYFGFAHYQVGWNAGPNSTVNGLEWHACPEILVAVRELALFLGRVEEIEPGPGGRAGELGPGSYYDVERLACVHLPAGTAFLLREGTLHLAPCRLEAAGFKSLVVLPRGTNEALGPEELDAARAAAAAGHGESAFLFARNKWLMAHPERKPLVEKGALPRLLGPNKELRFA